MQFPGMISVKQSLLGPVIADVEQEISRQFQQPWLQRQIDPKMRIAVAVGSRGIANINTIVRTACQELKSRGAAPFIVPAMGSHGGATAEGQIAVLRSLGITEEFCGVPIISSLEVVELGTTKDKVPVYLDKQAWQADGVVLVNRIKPHTDFSSPLGVESGLLKMSVIGLGKHAQAKLVHEYGIWGLRDFLPEAAEIVLNKGKVLCGLGIVENGRDETALIEIIPPSQIKNREPILLAEAMRFMPKLPVDEVDILIVDEIGKEISGTGMDTNIIGRIGIHGQAEPEVPSIKYIIASDLTDASHGNALGIGLADFTTRRLFEKIDFEAMNQNVLTSTFIRRGMIPLVLENTRECLKAAFRCNWGIPPKKAKIVRIANTLHLEHMYVSEELFAAVEAAPDFEISKEGLVLKFDDQGDLAPFGGVTHFK